MKIINVLFVCMGNICRSPTAEGVFQHLVSNSPLNESIHTDSAGTHAYHVGEQPDPRAQQTARTRGIDLSTQRARRVSSDDFHKFDYILAMDNDNLASLRKLQPADGKSQLQLFMDFAPELAITEVPDPYYGGSKGFEKVFDMVEIAAKGLLDHIKSNNFNN